MGRYRTMSLTDGERNSTDRFAIVPGRAACYDGTGFELRVLVALCAHGDGNGIARPSVATLCRFMGIDAVNNRGHVCRALRTLEAAGLIERLEMGGGRGRIGRYRILRKGVVPATSFANINGVVGTTRFQEEKRVVKQPETGSKTALKRVAGTTPEQNEQKRTDARARESAPQEGAHAVRSPIPGGDDEAAVIRDPDHLARIREQVGIACPSCGGGKSPAAERCSICSYVEAN